MLLVPVTDKATVHYRVPFGYNDLMRAEVAASSINGQAFDLSTGLTARSDQGKLSAKRRRKE
jgi:hypothetical protein